MIRTFNRSAALAALIVIIALSAPNAGAATDVTDGAGALSCAKYAKFYLMDPQAADNTFLSWARGYMSGADGTRMQEHEPAINLDPASYPVAEQTLYIHQYCGLHPQTPFLGAVMQVMFRLGFPTGPER